jgi:hypothetical protein
MVFAQVKREMSRASRDLSHSGSWGRGGPSAVGTSVSMVVIRHGGTQGRNQRGRGRATAQRSPPLAARRTLQKGPSSGWSCASLPRLRR